MLKSLGALGALNIEECSYNGWHGWEDWGEKLLGMHTWLNGASLIVNWIPGKKEKKKGKTIQNLYVVSPQKKTSKILNITLCLPFQFCFVCKQLNIS